MRICVNNNVSICFNSKKNKVRNNCSISNINFRARVNKDIFQKTLSNPLDTHSNATIISYLIKDKYGNLPIHYEFSDNLRIAHELFKNNLAMLIEMHLTKNSDGNLPIHIAGFKHAKEIHRVFENQPEILAQIHLTENRQDCIPMHNADLEKTKEIHRALENQPDVLAQIHLTKNRSGNLPIHNAGYYGLIEIHRALRNQPEVLAKIHLTKNAEGKFPKDSQQSNFDIKENLRREREVHRVITKCALDSDLDIDTSIELLETYNNKGKYSEAIEELKKQRDNL